MTPGIYVDRIVEVPMTQPEAAMSTTGRAPVEHLDRGPLDQGRAGRRWSPRDIPPGSYVNLGIGQPTTVADHLDAGAGRRAAHRERHARHGSAPPPATRSTPT